MVIPQRPVEICALAHFIIFAFFANVDLICYDLVSAQTIIQTKEKLAVDTKHRQGWGMLLGRLDESVIDKDDEPKQIGSINQRG